MSDFVASATFVNPYPASQNEADHGLYFRRTGNKRQAGIFLVTNRGERIIGWLNKGVPGVSDIGRTPAINTRTGEANRLQIAAIGSRGRFFINDRFIAAIDLSTTPDPSDITVFTGYLEGLRTTVPDSPQHQYTTSYRHPRPGLAVSQRPAGHPNQLGPSHGTGGPDNHLGISQGSNLPHRLQ